MAKEKSVTGYSGTPLVRKLGIRPGTTLLVRHEPKDYWDWISPLPDAVTVKSRPTGGLDFVHLFFTRASDFKKEVLAARKSLAMDGMIWISWPKKASRVETDLDENIIRDFALQHGLVDVKVCAVDETWSGLKLVIPRHLRSA